MRNKKGVIVEAVAWRWQRHAKAGDGNGNRERFGAQKSAFQSAVASPTVNIFRDPLCLNWRKRDVNKLIARQ